MTARVRHRWAAFSLLALVVVVLDQASKALVSASLQPGGVAPVIGDLLRIWYRQNNGAMLSLFADQAVVFAVLSIGVVALLVWYHGHAMASTGWPTTLALGLLAGGAVGN